MSFHTECYYVVTLGIVHDKHDIVRKGVTHLTDEDEGIRRYHLLRAFAFLTRYARSVPVTTTLIMTTAALALRRPSTLRAMNSMGLKLLAATRRASPSSRDLDYRSTDQGKVRGNGNINGKGGGTNRPHNIGRNHRIMSGPTCEARTVFRKDNEPSAGQVGCGHIRPSLVDRSLHRVQDSWGEILIALATHQCEKVLAKRQPPQTRNIADVWGTIGWQKLVRVHVPGAPEVQVLCRQEGQDGHHGKQEGDHVGGIQEPNAQ